MADCEALHDGLLREPVNALSSLAYVAAGVALWPQDRRVGAALVVVGAGSVAYHGTGGPAAKWLHDLSIVAIAGLIAAGGRNAVLGARVHPRLALLGTGAFALALPLQAFGRTGGALCRPDSFVQAHAGWHALTALAIGCAFALAARGRAVPRHSARTVDVEAHAST